uniref:Ribosomal protein L2 n=1 Tax=Babesia rodhaini TaxID=5870 RepID=A0A455R038_BABRO|nr:ribosomal protein L2 [Babesia rodhaini]
MILYLFNYKRKLGRNNFGFIINRGKCNFKNNKYYIINNYYYFNNNNIVKFNNIILFINKIINNLFYRNSLLIECLDLSNKLNNNYKKNSKLFIKSLNIKKGDFINLFNTLSLNEGDSSYIYKFSYGDNIFNIENYKTNISTYSKSYLSFSTILCFNYNYYFIKLPSNFIIKIYKISKVFLGKPDGLNINYKNKAGISKVFGIRPLVRGKAMNAADHPHGGGTGKTSIGHKSIYSIYGNKLKGVKTSKRKK